MLIISLERISYIIEGFLKLTNIASGRTSREHFSHIVNKIQTKLSGWKQHCLSLAGRITLCNSVLSSIPYYHMQ